MTWRIQPLATTSLRRSHLLLWHCPPLYPHLSAFVYVFSSSFLDHHNCPLPLPRGTILGCLLQPRTCRNLVNRWQGMSCRELDTWCRWQGLQSGGQRWLGFRLDEHELTWKGCVCWKGGKRERVGEGGKEWGRRGGGKEGKSEGAGEEWEKWERVGEVGGDGWGKWAIIEEVKNTAQKWSMHVVIGRAGKVNQFG